jgi:hypothetical protein
MAYWMPDGGVFRPAEGLRLRDEFQNEFVLSDEIGSGGQGEVWSLLGGGAAAKFLFSDNDAAREALRTRLQRIARSDLTGIPIATPLALVDGPVGYIMELLEDMVSLSTLFIPPRGADQVGWYRDTGGLRRRLIVLANTADALHRLHAKALAYCDLSPNNVLVSRWASFDHIWLIDPDNLAAESDRAGLALHTPTFGAPEVVRGDCANDTLSDVFSLALMVFRVLVNNHPFYGDAVQYDTGLETEAYSGGLPWIDHPTDTRNRSTRGVPRDWVLTGGLARLAGRAFEAGLADPAARPSAAEWRDELLRAADFTVACPGCDVSVYAFHGACPWCSTVRSPLLLTNLRTHIPPIDATSDPCGETVPLNHTIVLTPEKPVLIDTRRALTVLDSGPGRAPVSPGEPVAELTWHGAGDLTVRRTGHYRVLLVDPDNSRGIQLSPYEARPLPVTERRLWDIRFGTADTVHRMLSIGRYSEAGR